jgi:osmoprotectant transport system ATP-binding protein
MIISFDDLSFHRDSARPILERVNLTIGSGEIVAIVGRSGVGKTTLLKLVNRLLLPTSGTVFLDGRDSREWDEIRLRRSMGYVFQEAGLFPHFTVEENIGVVPRLESWDPVRVRSRARELLNLVGLPPEAFAERRPHELSGGQRQRVGLARALGVNPPVLLMDEPFGALDPVTRSEVRHKFQRIHDQLHMTVILVTHDMAEALTLGHRVGVIDGGVLIACDTPATIAANADPRVRELVQSIPRPAINP